MLRNEWWAVFLAMWGDYALPLFTLYSYSLFVFLDLHLQHTAEPLPLLCVSAEVGHHLQDVAFVGVFPLLVVVFAHHGAEGSSSVSDSAG